MFGSRHTRLAAGIASGLATTALFATVAAAAGKPAGMTQQAYAALKARGEALNKLYGLGEYASSSRDAAGKPAGMTQQEYAALKARSEALNKLYGLGEYASSTRDAAARPAGMTYQEYAALKARSEALNKKYGLGTYANLPRDEALNARYGNEWTKLSAAEFKTLVDLFGSEVTQTPLPEIQAAVARRLTLDRQPRTNGTTSVTTSSGFDWRDSAIGAAATVGVLLLGSAGAIAVRRRGGPTTLADRHSHA